MTKEERDVN